MSNDLALLGQRWIARFEGLLHACVYELERLEATNTRLQAEQCMQGWVDIKQALDEVPHAQFTELAIVYPVIGQRLTALQDRLHKLQQKLYGEAYETLNLGEGNDNE